MIDEKIYIILYYKTPRLIKASFKILNLPINLTS